MRKFNTDSKHPHPAEAGSSHMKPESRLLPQAALLPASRSPGPRRSAFTGGLGRLKGPRAGRARLRAMVAHPVAGPCRVPA